MASTVDGKSEDQIIVVPVTALGQASLYLWREHLLSASIVRNLAQVRKILSIEDGTVLESFNHLLDRNKVDFIEQFNEKLPVKQENENLQILDKTHFRGVFKEL
ncbi:hypothetical protein Fot_03181 [Forsythia ovata]|uniref:Uncharacterized protein n=1 Tax=Forsythia ovata TaxID=205694 RepID=A0ABD1X923_9LAMI